MDYLLGAKQSWVLKESLDEHFILLSSSSQDGMVVKIEPKYQRANLGKGKPSDENEYWSKDEIRRNSKIEYLSKVVQSVIVKIEPLYLEMKSAKVELGDYHWSKVYPEVESNDCLEAKSCTKPAPALIKTEMTASDEETNYHNKKKSCQELQPLEQTSRSGTVIVKIEPLYLEMKSAKVEPGDYHWNRVYPKVESNNCLEAKSCTKAAPALIRTEMMASDGETNFHDKTRPCQELQPFEQTSRSGTLKRNCVKNFNSSNQRVETTRNLELMEKVSSSGHSKVIVLDPLRSKNFVLHKVCDLKQVVRRKNREYYRDSVLLRGIKKYPPRKGDGKLSYVVTVKKLKVVKQEDSILGARSGASNNIAFECILCHRAYAKENVLKRHMVYHKNMGRYKCSQCTWSFSSSGDLGMHMRSHTLEKPHCCKICGKRFSQKGNLATHMNYHEEKRLFTCDHCDKSFFTKSHMDRHILYVHTKEKDRPHECSKCGKRFPTLSCLAKHFRMHSLEKPYSCPQCSQSFGHLSHMTRHLKSHTGERAYECKECKKAFKTNDDLKRHAVVHSSERNHKCDKCEATFKSKGILRAHARIHTGLKPHQCKQCGKRFMVNCRLKRHIQDVHESTGERPFACDQCDRTYRKMVYLKNHKLVHSGKRPHRCEICGSCFVYKGVLEAHLIQVHKKDKIRQRRR